MSDEPTSFAEIRDHWIAAHSCARQQIAELRHALTVILPMAKGYAAVNDVGNNAAMVAWAEGILEKNI